MAIIGFFVGLFVSVVIAQRIMQRHLFRLQKRQLVEEFQVVDLSSSGFGSSSTFVQGPSVEELHDEERGNAVALHALTKPSALHPDDELHLRKLGLVV